MSAVTTTNRGKVTGKVTEEDLRHHSQELGTFGAIFGSRENAPVYFAGLLALVSLIGAILVGVFAQLTPDKSDLVKALTAIVIAALSFLGGASGRSKSNSG